MFRNTVWITRLLLCFAVLSGCRYVDESTLAIVSAAYTVDQDGNGIIQLETTGGIPFGGGLYSDEELTRPTRLESYADVILLNCTVIRDFRPDFAIVHGRGVTFRFTPPLEEPFDRSLTISGIPNPGLFSLDTSGLTGTWVNEYRVSAREVALVPYHYLDEPVPRVTWTIDGVTYAPGPIGGHDLLTIDHGGFEVLRSWSGTDEYLFNDRAQMHEVSLANHVYVNGRPATSLPTTSRTVTTQVDLFSIYVGIPDTTILPFTNDIDVSIGEAKFYLFRPFPCTGCSRPASEIVLEPFQGTIRWDETD